MELPPDQSEAKSYDEHARNQEKDPRENVLNRRSFIPTAAVAGAMPLLSAWLPTPANGLNSACGAECSDSFAASSSDEASASLIGAYGDWASHLVENPPKLSFRRPEETDVALWRQKARAMTLDCLAPPNLGKPSTTTVVNQTVHDGLHIEEIEWQMPCGKPTQAVVLKPMRSRGRLPGILALHDHGGNKYFGYRKIVDLPSRNHPLMANHRQEYYEGRAWANEFARRGYVVLVHDTFAFGSRRVLLSDMREIPWGGSSTSGRTDVNSESAEQIGAYNTWAAEHEHIMAKSLFCAGTTWPGVFLSEDRRALDIIAARDDVDHQRIACAGLSGGGLRTVYLAGLDERIRCANCVGFMSTWHDFLVNKSYTHTWMTYAPLLPRYLDFPEILGLRVPLPTLVQNCDDDQLYTFPQMQQADRILREIFAKAGHEDRYRGEFYPGGHKFDIAMQESALSWFDRWLKA